jgi:ascorbate-specific PTS system EIIC-type component UlaA
MKKSVIATSHYCVVITTIIAYALLAPIFFEMDNAYGERETVSVVDNDKTTITHSQQQVEAECKSPCSDSGKMCIAMCE